MRESGDCLVGRKMFIIEKNQPLVLKIIMSFFTYFVLQQHLCFIQICSSNEIDNYLKREIERDRKDLSYRTEI